MGLGSYKKNLGFVYAIAWIALAWFLLTFLYQYIAAAGSIGVIFSALKESRILSALWLSIFSSFATVFLGVIFGIPIAYLFAVKEFRGKALVETLSIDVPQTFPPVAEGMIYLLMLGPGSPLHINLAFTFTALVVAKFYVSVPFVISFAMRRFREINEQGIHLTARSLGANPFQVFRYIFIPLAWRDIAAGTSLCWSRAMGELGGSMIFAGVITYKTEIIPTFIIGEASNLPTQALAASIIATTASVLALFFFKKVTRR